MTEMNQCDGCRRGLPVVDGVHAGDRLHYAGAWVGWPDFIACTRDRYEAP